MEYLGYKGSLLGDVLSAIEGNQRGPLRVLDAFCGTAAVSAELRNRGHEVHANDHLSLCVAWADAALLAPPDPEFGSLKKSLRGSYEAVVDYLDGLEPIDGFIARHYSPMSLATDGVERRYLTVDNARRIDAIRLQIDKWERRLTDGERGLLLSTLVLAVMDVSNTAATYGCFLKGWKSKALQPLKLRPLELPTNDSTSHYVTCGDAVEIAAEAEVDVLYADPPYTKRQYAAYYHLLETLVRNDEPELLGITGLRPWQPQSSDWCYRRKAPAALEALVAKSQARRVVLSYSEDGQIEHEQIIEILRGFGKVAFREIRQRRYRSSNLPHKGADVIERIYTMDRA